MGALYCELQLTLKLDQTCFQYCFDTKKGTRMNFVIRDIVHNACPVLNSST